MTLKPLMNVQTIRMMFIKISKNAIQQKPQNIDCIFDNMIADMLSNEKPNPKVTKLFIRDTTLNISLTFIAQSCFAVPKKVLG